MPQCTPGNAVCQGAGWSGPVRFVGAILTGLEFGENIDLW